MYHKTRWLHRWFGVIAGLFLAIIAVTGFLLATKGTFGWVRPPESTGTPGGSLEQVVPLDSVAKSAFGVGLANLSEPRHIDRIDYRPKSNIFKVLSKEGYHEVQIDGASGKVLAVNYRTDQLAEDIHDFSFFSDFLHNWWLPVVGVFLAFLSISGICMFFVPPIRRWRFKRRQKS